MTHEEAARILDPEEREQALFRYDSYERLGKLKEACWIAAQALRNLQPGCNKLQLNRNSLTLEQLRKMDGQPVWVEDLEKPKRSGWRLIYWDRGKYMVLLSKSVEGYISEEYGKTWLAYAYHPAHIDREAWEPCEFCGKADFGEYGFEIGRSYAKVACALGSWRFPTKEQFHFCPKCGRPMTEEAWAELENRMGARV